MRNATRWMAGLVFMGVLVIGLAPPAFASPPANDDFANATVVSSLPFSDSGDLADTTAEANEPFSGCAINAVHTAWYAFTPTDSGYVTVGLAGSDRRVSVAAFQPTWPPGIAGLSPIGCAGDMGFDPPLTIATTAGSTYYLRVATGYADADHLELRIEQVGPPPNDDFVNAEALSGIPVVASADLSAATIEPGEPAPGGESVIASAWYSYTPAESGTLVVSADPAPDVRLAVFTGTSLEGLSELAAGAAYFPPLYFPAEAGTTYFIQAAKTEFMFTQRPTVTVMINQPAPPTAGIWAYPWDVSTYETVQFFDSSYDPERIGFGPGQWDFGDGEVAVGCCTTHRYAADGDYTVTRVVTTLDGRTATATQQVTVRTHDVSIERIQAPNSAGVGQAKSISVKVRGGRYDETVRVDLFKSMPGGSEEWVGSETKAVPQAHGGRATGFGFTYTFTPDDRANGKVTFRAVASIVDRTDAQPADNQAIAPPTEVKR